mgnify:CR=1 FL=1
MVLSEDILKIKYRKEEKNGKSKFYLWLQKWPWWWKW